MDETIKSEKELHDVLKKKRIMIIGEGAVFFALLLIGIVQVRRSLRKEMQLARQQSNFLLSVTHELKSPIASARLQMETLLLRDISKEKQKEILTNAINETDRLNALVENLLLAAQIEKNSFSVHKQNMDISEYLVKLLSGPAVAAKHKLQLVIQPGIHLNADRVNFASIVLNLVDNACKYSSADSSVIVELKKQNNCVILNVKDEGKGIPDEEKKHVFDKFYRIGNEETRSTKGTGLGLYIVKHLVEEHNGTIKISDNKPKGTCFQIEFKP